MFLEILLAVLLIIACGIAFTVLFALLRWAVWKIILNNRKKKYPRRRI